MGAPPDHTHKWTVALRSAASLSGSDTVGGADDISYFVKRVTFKLHDTYQNPSRTVERPPFEVTETGWGEFEVTIRVAFVTDAGEKAIQLYHHMKLHPWPAPGEPEIPPLQVALAHGPVHSWQYDEFVFHEPTLSFYNTLMAHPPTPLPKVKTRPVPYHPSNPKALEEAKGGTPEFTAVMEKDEAERLEVARKAVIAEQEKWKDILSEKEKELAKLHQQLAAQQ